MPASSSEMRRAILTGIDAGDGDLFASERIDEVLGALDRAGFQVITKSDALAAARCVNVAGVLGTPDPDGLARRLEPDW